ncbi:hypothetical protein BCR44DRAFT_127466 [Catenaria anguillulae PL171]|uniref:Peptidase M14 domain-containing protein n=1 Tax=Catenaria anguillulae PL171 TaxID=765915 RepID=A0A1Y2HLZ7_9FUNG|nr:hypothetical protein BCR44DRAFT_127466 [Catenaria anguillulae PL171]
MRKTNRPALLITSGMHSREWIATAMAVNLLDVWTAGYGSNQLVTDLLNGFEIIFVPMVNPDGYNESFKSRLWRKNMQLFAGDCVGVDLNRNFPTDEWSDPQDFWASSPDPCDETFRGPAPGSAPETQALMALVREYQSKTGGMMKIFIDTHSYSQLWMFPTGYDCYSEYPELQELFDVSALATETILGVHGKEYYYGDICNTIYPASGSATDWMFAKANIRYSFALELRDTGDHGFLLPPEEIVHTVEEMHAGILAAVAGFISRHPSAAPAAAPVPASPVPIADTAPVAA